MAKLWRMESCRFQRKKHSKWEIGILLNEGELGILDRNGKKVNKAWTWYKTMSFALDIGEILTADEELYT